MRYVALLSGGKDSCYNLVHCRKNGHDLVAAASLGPEQGKEELDSYLYQTVGQDAIHTVARALDVPLYRRVISGIAVEQGSEYGGRSASGSGGIAGDETEDLYALLATVKEHHPDVQGVSVGAILSNYQRVRVEHVCRRLGLTPLCYLWQRDQAELFSEMVQTGMNSVLIKVAGIGLTVKHLGKSLAEMQSTLVKLNGLYGSHICGEGGEYETLTLDCPLFKRKIVLTNVETVVHSDSDFATVAYLRVNAAALEEKVDLTLPQATTPPLLADEFDTVHDAVQSSQESNGNFATVATTNLTHTPSLRVALGHNERGRWIAVTNVTAESDLGCDLEDEVRRCFSRLQESLAQYSLELRHVANINIFIASMDLFARINAVYNTFFGTSPPARACVAIDLPAPTRVKLDCLAFVETSPADREALHVQSLSYWAPANIGPYSQAILIDQRMFISGQIGMIPKDLSLPSPKSLAFETALACQHVQRVVDALSANRWDGHSQAVLYWLISVDDVQRVRRAAQLCTRDHQGITLFVVVPSLPKGALVEKQVQGHTGRYSEEDEGELVCRTASPTFIQDTIDGEPGSSVHWEVSDLCETSSPTCLLTGKGDANILQALHTVASLSRCRAHALSIRLFHKVSKSVPLLQLQELFPSVPVTDIPVRHISTKGEDDWDYAALVLTAT